MKILYTILIFLVAANVFFALDPQVYLEIRLLNAFAAGYSIHFLVIELLDWRDSK